MQGDSDLNHVVVLCSTTRFTTCQWVACWAGRTSRQARETGGTNGPELSSRLAVVEKGDAPARLADLLDAPSIHPITVILAIRRERIVSTKSQGAVNLTEAEQRPINVRGRERRNAGRKLKVRRSRDPLIRAAAEAANIKTPTA